MRRIAFTCAVAVVVLALPAAADAATICVPALGPGCDSAAATPQAAADAAAEGDLVRIAAGGFPGVATGKRLTFVGAGASATVLAGSAAAPIAMELDHGGVLRDLTARGAPGSPGSGAPNTSGTPSGAGVRIFVDDPTPHDLTLEGVIAQGGPAADVFGGASGVDVTHLSGGGGPVVPTISVRGGAILAGDGVAPVGIPPAPGEPPSYPIPQPALNLNGRLYQATVTGTLIRGGSLLTADGRRGDAAYIYGGNLTLRGATAEGGTALGVSHAHVRVDHSTLSGQTAGLEVLPLGTTMMGPIELSDSLVSAVPVAGQRGAAAVAFYAPAGTGRIDARGSTLFARGAVTAAFAQVASGTGTIASTLRNTLVLALGSSPSAVDLLATTGTVDATHSAYRTYRLGGGATAPAPGSGTNVAASPMVDPRLVPLAGSPLMDAGDAGIVAGGETDRLGNLRSTDGDGDCVARPDIGAFERAAAPCNVRPVVSAFRATHTRFAPVSRHARRARVHRGTSFRFRLSERARVTIGLSRVLPGRRAHGRCAKPTRRNRGARRCLRVRGVGRLRASAGAGRRSIHFSGRLRGRPLPAGRYRATLVARYDLGASSRPRSIALRIVRPGR